MTNELYIKRRENKKTQSDVAKVLSLSVTGYCLKETGKNDFTQSEMVKIAKLFNCTLDELFMN